MPAKVFQENKIKLYKSSHPVSYYKKEEGGTHPKRIKRGGDPHVEVKTNLLNLEIKLCAITINRLSRRELLSVTAATYYGTMKKYERFVKW